MPIYHYRCKDCGHDFEIQQSFSDDALDTCPECSGALKKVYGNVGISFKGSGFYKNDARSGSSTSGSSTSTTTSTSSDSGSTSGDGGSSKESSSSSDSSSSTTKTTAPASTSSSSSD